MTRFWQTACEVDRRLREAGVEYCITKCYGENLHYDHGNIDVVVDVPLWALYRRVFADAFFVRGYDATKHLLYERNKLMLTPREGPWHKIHLHSNVGWHNVCFIGAGELFAHARDFEVGGRKVRIAERDMEARILVLHVIFEQFKKKPEDAAFLRGEDFDRLAEEFQLPAKEMAIIREAPVGPLEYAILRPVWRRFYRVAGLQVTVWNRFLHWGLVCVDRWRRWKRKR